MYTKKKSNLVKIILKILTQGEKAKHKPSGYSWSLICSFDATKSKHNFYREKDCIERFCKDVKELAIEISNYRKKEMIPLIDERIKLYKRQKGCRICKKEFCYGENDKKINLDYTKKSEIIVIKPENLEELLMIFAI